LGKSVRIVDTTFRDAHQSLMATRMSTDHMLPIAEKIDQVGFFSLEVWGGATFDVCIRYLGEDPWERLRSLKKRIRKTPLQMLLRGQNVVGYRNYPDDVVIKFVEKAFENGMDIFRIFDALNDVRNMETAIKTAKRVGAHVQGCIITTISPVHTPEYYIEIAKRLVELECDSLCLKDSAGMMMPQVAYDILSSFRKEFGSLPIDLHCHSTSGMALMAYLRACDVGVDILDTAFSPLAGGTSQPPVETVVAALKNTPYDTGLDLELLVEIAEYFWGLREKYFDRLHLISPEAERVDVSVLIHKIPGGMYSNLISQLKEQNALDKLKEILEEVPRIYKEVGYPPLVTPASQFVGTQAVLNVLSGERYKMVIKELKDYVKGLYGKPPAPIDDEIRKKIIGDEEVITCRPADLLKPELGAVPKEVEPFIESEEDILTYVLFPKTAPEFFKKRELKRQEKVGELLVPERQELEEIAALSTAIATYLTRAREAIVVVPVRKLEKPPVWSMAGRQELMRYGRLR